jgi:hypothetical protein
MARQILTIYENVHLNRGLAQRADELSQKLMIQKLELMLQREPALRHLRESAATEDVARTASGDPHHTPGPGRPDSFPQIRP